MKSFVFFTMVLCITIMMSWVCNAQQKWNSKEEAEEFFSLNFQDIEAHIYEPKFFGDHSPLREGENIVELDYYVVVKMRVVNGIFWVIQKPSTKFVEKEGKVIRRWDCGNSISGFYKLTPPTSPLTQESLAFKPKDGIDGQNGIDGRDGRDGVIPPITVVVDNGGFPWATLIVATLTLGVAGLCYLVVNKYYNSLKNSSSSSTSGGSSGGILNPSKGIQIGFQYEI